MKSIRASLATNAVAFAGCVLSAASGCSDKSATERDVASDAEAEQNGREEKDSGGDLPDSSGQQSDTEVIPTQNSTGDTPPASEPRDSGISATVVYPRDSAASDAGTAEPGSATPSDAATSSPQTTQSATSNLDAGGSSVGSGSDAATDADADGSLCVSPPLPHVVGAHTVLSEGHSDVITVALDCDARRLRLSVGEQDRSSGVVTQREMESALIQADDAALFSWPEDTSYLPAGFEWVGTPGEPLWLLPEVQVPEVIWAGFDSYDVPAEVLPGGAFDVHLVNVEGPGTFNLWSNGIGFGLEFMFSPDQDILTWRVEAGVHRHFNWSFTAPGLYRLTFQATAVVNGVPIDSPEQTMRVFIGELEDLPESEPTVLKINGARASYAIGETVTLTADQYGATSELPLVWYQTCPVDGEFSEREEVATGQTMDFELSVEDLPCIIGVSLVEDGQEVVVAQTVSHGDFIDWSTFVPAESQQ